MMNLRQRTLALQRLEQSAGEKAGLRMRLVDDAALTGKGAKDYIAGVAETVINDIADELKAAAALGVELGEAIKSATG